MFSVLLPIIYLSFISLGLPDAVLGAAWPVMYPQFGVPVSFMGPVGALITVGTITSSLLSDRLTKRFGTGKVTAFSVAATAFAMFGFSVSRAYWQILLFALPYGLGAGGVDASLNNYVALHYTSRHMSWLHSMWGIGASVGPYIMAYALTSGQGWNLGYGYIAILQFALTVVLFISIPKWKGAAATEGEGNDNPKPLTLGQILKLPGAKSALVTFLCYCALEQTVGSWVSSYFVMVQGMAEDQAASFASLFFTGLTVGRFLSGFLTMRLDDTAMVRLGETILGIGIVILILPLEGVLDVIGLLLVGLGSAPIFPCIIHSTPSHFGAENSQAVIGVQMASAYAGCLIAPPLFGVLAQWITPGILPWYLAVIFALMVLMYERLERISPVSCSCGK